jgi:regulator of RNase E activity RraA
MREKESYWSSFAVIGFCLFALPAITIAQIGALENDLPEYTALWTGERFSDGRPKVPEDILERMKDVSIEEAWGVLRGKGYKCQFEGGWVRTGKNPVLVGRALTAVFMPLRPDVNDVTKSKIEREGQSRSQNKLVINRLVENDVMVVDLFGKVFDGAFIGDNLANNIYALSGKGMVIDGGSRDLDGVSRISDFTAFNRGWNPTGLSDVMLMGINIPIRIGSATVMPGDVVLGGREGVIFVPAHLAQEVVEGSELARVRDRFRTKCFQEKKYPLELIYGRWSEEIEEGYRRWLQEEDRKGRLTPYQREQLLK